MFAEDFVNIGEGGLCVRQVCLSRLQRRGRMNSHQASPSGWPCTLSPICCPWASLACLGGTSSLCSSPSFWPCLSITSSFFVMIYVSVSLLVPQSFDYSSYKSQNGIDWFLPFSSSSSKLLVILLSLLLHIIFGITLSIPIKSLAGILIGIALNLYINNQLTHNCLPIKEILTEDRAAFRAWQKPI